MCVYICMIVCMYITMYVHVCNYVCMYVCMSVSVCLSVCSNSTPYQWERCFPLGRSPQLNLKLSLTVSVSGENILVNTAYSLQPIGLDGN